MAMKAKDARAVSIIERQAYLRRERPKLFRVKRRFVCPTLSRVLLNSNVIPRNKLCESLLRAGYPTRHPAPFPALPDPPLLAIIIRLWPCYGAAGIIYPTPSLPHDIFHEGFFAHQEPASERARRICVVRLRTPSFPRAGVLFAARSVAEQRLHPYRIACCPQLDWHLWGLSFGPRPAILGSRIIPAAHIFWHARHTLVSFASGADSDCEDARRNLAAHVRAFAARHPAPTFS